MESLDAEKEKITNLKMELSQARAKKDELGVNYYNYSRLNYNLGLAENNAFTYGALYKKILQEIEVTELENLSEVQKEVLEEEKDIDRKSSKRVYQNEDEYFNSVESIDF